MVCRITMRNNILSLTFGLRSQPPVSIVSLPSNLTPRCQCQLWVKTPLAFLRSNVSEFFNIYGSHQEVLSDPQSPGTIGTCFLKYPHFLVLSTCFLKITHIFLCFFLVESVPAMCIYIVSGAKDLMVSRGKVNLPTILTPISCLRRC